jgi:hypothetical protein
VRSCVRVLLSSSSLRIIASSQYCAEVSTKEKNAQRLNLRTSPRLRRINPTQEPLPVRRVDLDRVLVQVDTHWKVADGALGLELHRRFEVLGHAGTLFFVEQESV